MPFAEPLHFGLFYGSAPSVSARERRSLRCLRISIRAKLGLIAGIPVLGAVLLAFLIVGSARDDLKKAAALGSIESLSELSNRMTDLVHALQSERAASALQLGKSDEDRKVVVPIAAQATDTQLASLAQFLASLDQSKLQRRLSGPLGEARRHLQGLATFREKMRLGGTSLDDIDNFYSAGTGSLIHASAGLTDLSDDGELLRLLNSLSLALELEERMSKEHMLLADVFAERRFQPGSYRNLVSLISEQEIYTSVYRTSASLSAINLFDGALRSEAVKRSEALRTLALDSNEDELEMRADEWFAVQATKLSLIERVERSLNEESRKVALQKLLRARRSVTVSLSLAGGVIVISLALAWAIAYGLTRRVLKLRDAAVLVAKGDLSARVTESASDELGELGASFNAMVGDLSRSRAALGDQARMTRELEIASAIQRAMLPPVPAHPEYEFAGLMRPADEVGGDFYDVLTKPESNELWITVGDVSGHGVGAGLVMLMAQAAFASHFLNDAAASPEAVLRHVNALLCENIQTRLRDDKYITAQLLIHSGAGRFECVGAHEWPIVYRARTGKCQVIEAPGPWLGITKQLDEIPICHIELDKHDVLCLYSDGITEAQNESNELFDMDRMCRVLEESLSHGAELPVAISEVFAAVERFSGRHDDDWTLLLVRRA